MLINYRNTYDEIVNELLSEREQAIRIAQAYKEEYEKYILMIKILSICTTL